MPQRVLVVEDDEIQRAVLVDFLENQGCYVEWAADGLEGFRKARVGRFDAILLDFRIPAFDGAVLARLIADLTNENRRPKLVALSATSPDDLTGGGSGANPFDAALQKPFAFMDLMKLIAHPNEHASAMSETWRLDAKQRPPSEPQRTDIQSILIVDDDEALAELIAEPLRNCGFAVERARNGFAALSRIKQDTFDIAIIDFNMPALDGVAVARLTCDLVHSRHRPRLIALTATPDRISQREGTLVSDFDEIIEKSAGMGPLIEAVQRCAAYKKMRPQSAGLGLEDMLLVADALAP